MPDPAVVTRFAPSPTGHLHKGHAYAALKAYHFAKEQGGKFLLRIEDIDFNRCSSDNTHQILEDLAWLGLEWEEPVRIQSEHLQEYAQVAGQLEEQGVLYPCFCTRKDILREIEEAGRAPHGSEGPLYPGTCRRISEDERISKIGAGDSYSLRLNLEKAIASVGVNSSGPDLTWTDTVQGTQQAKPEKLGDVVLVRKDIGTSYHLAVVIDDGIQEVTDVVRGVDLFDSTHIHCVIQALLGLPTPRYHHHELLTDAGGRRLAKRDQAITLKSLRDSGTSVQELKKELGYLE